MSDDRLDAFAKDGTPITIPTDRVEDLKKIGGRLATPTESAEVEKNIRLQEYSLRRGGILGAAEGIVGPAVAGLARGVSLGLSDVAATEAADAIGGKEFGGAVRQRLRDYQDVSPVISGVAEFEGGAALGALTAGESTGASLLGAGARGAIENAIYGAGKDASEAALDDEAVGEKVVAGLGSHALFGFGLGAGLSALGRGIGALRGVSTSGPRSLGEAAAARATMEAAEPEARGAEAYAIQGGQYGGPQSDWRPAEGLPRAQFSAQVGEESTVEGPTWFAREGLNGRAPSRVRPSVINEDAFVPIERTGTSVGLAPQVFNARGRVDAAAEPIRFRLEMRAPEIDASIKPGTREYRRALVERGMMQPTEAHAMPFLDNLGDNPLDLGMSDSYKRPIIMKGKEGERFVPSGGVSRTLSSITGLDALAAEDSGVLVRGMHARDPRYIGDSATRGLSSDVAPVTTRGWLGDWAGSMAERLRLKSIGATKEAIEKLQATGKSGELIEEMKPILNAGLSRKETLELTKKAIEESKAKRPEMFHGLDELQVGLPPDPYAFARRIEDEVMDPLTAGTDTDGNRIALPGNEPELDAAEALAQSFRDMAAANKAPTFRQWVTTVRGLERRALPNSAAREVQSKVYQMANEQLGAAGEQAARTAGPTLSASYRANEHRIEALTRLEELISGGEKNASKKSFDLVGQAAKAAGSFVSAGVTGVAGGTVGKMAGGTVEAGIKGFADSYANRLAASLLEHIAAASTVRQVAARTEARMARGVDELVPSAARRLRPLGGLGAPVRTPLLLGIQATADRRKDHEAMVTSLAKVSSDPMQTSMHLERALGDMDDVPPKATEAALSTALRGINYLKSKMPASKQDPYSLQPQLQKGTRVSDAEMSTFRRTAEAVDDPTIVLREAKSGTLTRDHVDAVKAVYPKLYAQMQGMVVQQVIQTGTQLPYSTRIQLGILLDIPTDATLAPDFQRAIQATYTSSEQAGAEIPPPNLA